MEQASSSDCRSVLVPIMAAQPDRIFRAAELAKLLERSPLQLTRRADRLVFESLRKARRRGWVVKVGRGQYRYGAVPRTTLQRISRWHRGLEMGLSGPQRSEYASWHHDRNGTRRPHAS